MRRLHPYHYNGIRVSMVFYSTLMKETKETCKGMCGRAQTHRLGLMTALDRSSTSICGQGTKPLTYPFPYPKITKLCQLLVYPKGIQHVSRKPLVVTSVQGKMITTQNMPHSILASTGMSETILHIDRTPRSQPASQYRDAKTGDPICPDVNWDESEMGPAV